MTTIKSFHNRLAKIGINITLIGNYPWIYLDTINGKRVKEKFEGNHGFTAFFLSIRRDDPQEHKITDVSEIFKLIRKYI